MPFFSHINSASVQVAGHRTEYARVGYGTNVVTDYPNKDNMGRVIDINVGTVVARFQDRRLGFCVTILVMICHANYAHSHCWNGGGCERCHDEGRYCLSGVDRPVFWSGPVSQSVHSNDSRSVHS
jgi:hypothetical protein